MIISASRRTDIPACYSEWLFNRIREKYVLVRNPMNPRQVGRISLDPAVTDGIVFWTKNPIPMLDRLDELRDYPFYFQFTLNSYGKDVEPHIPSKSRVMAPTFQRLSSMLGKERVVWRYDPVFFNETYTLDYHCRYFRALADRLGDHTEQCTVSFLDFYQNTARNARSLNIGPQSRPMQLELMGRFSEIAADHGIALNTCAEKMELDFLGISHAHCIDRDRLERIGGFKLSVQKDKNQRPECGCIASIDIGAYNTCENGCLYCYANYSSSTAAKNRALHDPASPLLFGVPGPEDRISVRQVQSCRNCQLDLFEIK